PLEGLGGFGETWSEPPDRAVRPENRVLSRPGSGDYRGSLRPRPRNDHRSPATSNVPPNPPRHGGREARRTPATRAHGGSNPPRVSTNDNTKGGADEDQDLRFRRRAESEAARAVHGGR